MALFSGDAYSDPLGWREEVDDLIRGLAAGAIVAMPLLYTMEMWWHGMTLSPGHLLVLLGATLAVNYGFTLLSGFRRKYSPLESLLETFTAVAIGLIFSAVILWVMGQITFSSPLNEIIGKCLLEAAAVSLGVSFANSQVRDRSRDGEDSNAGGEESLTPRDLQLRADLRDAAATIAGATVFTMNIAPTQEVQLVASDTEPWRKLVMLAVMFLLCYAILYAAGFKEHKVFAPSLFQHPLVETLFTVALSLLSALALLALMAPQQSMGSLSAIVTQTVVLGLPATVGGAAGRLIV